MRGRHNWYRQARLQRDATLEAQQLCRDLALVMKRGYHSVELAFTGADEHCVWRQRAECEHARGSGSLNRWRDYIDLFGSQQPAFACVWIERRHAYARFAAAPSQHYVELIDHGVNPSCS